MAILVTCSACGAKLRVRDEYLGKDVWCPSCKAALTLTGERVPNHEVFVSYSNKDKAVADAICATLEEKHIRCWIAPRDISAGNSWGGSIIEAIEDAQVMVLVYSGHSNLSPQIIREVERAVAKGLLIVPFRIEAAPMSKDMEYFLSSSHWFDALTPPLEKHLTQFTEMVRLILFKKAQAKDATTSTAPLAALNPRASTLPWKGAATAILGAALVLGIFLGVRQYQQQKDAVTPLPANLPGAVQVQIQTPAFSSAAINAIASTVPAEAKLTPASTTAQVSTVVPPPQPVVAPAATIAPRANTTSTGQTGTEDNIPSEGLLAHYNFARMTQAEVDKCSDLNLINAGLTQGGVCLNGIHTSDGPNGCDAIISTPKLDYSAFTVLLKFKATKFETYSPLLTAGDHRWFTLSRDPSSHLFVGLESCGKLSNTRLKTDQWYTVACSVNVTGRKVMMFVGGEKATVMTLPPDFTLNVIGAEWHATDKEWSFKNLGGSYGRMFDGLIGEVAIYNGALAPDDCQKLSARP